MMAVILAAVMICSAAFMSACGGGGAKSDSGTKESGGSEGTAEESDLNIAMITDSGDITDQSFNQTTYEASKEWASENGATFNYYKPEGDSDEARSASVDQAIAEGANIVVMPGYMFAAQIVEKSNEYPEVKFIGLDMTEGDVLEKGVGVEV